MGVERFAARGPRRSGAGGAVVGGERRERFPAFGAGHAEVDGIVGIGGEVDGLALGIEVDAERAAGAAKAADHVRRPGGSETRGDAAESEAVRGGVLHELGGHRTGAGVKEIFEGAHAGTPGIFGASTARKKR
jgi:hypothetical protein